MQVRMLILTLALLAVATGVQAQTVLVQAGQLLDRPEAAPRGATTVLIVGGVATEVRDGHHGADAFNATDARVIDLREHFVLPALIDSHVHLTSDLGGVAGQLERASAASPTTRSKPRATRGTRWLRASPRCATSAMATARSPLRDAINAGKLPGPRILTANTRCVGIRWKTSIC